MSLSYYNRNLHDYVAAIKDPVYVTPTNGYTFPLNGRFKTLPQTFAFGPQELLGMKSFFTQARFATNSAGRRWRRLTRCATSMPSITLAIGPSMCVSISRR